MFPQKVNTGVLEDNRSDAEKAKDYSISELLPTRGEINVNSLPTEPRTFKIRNQASSGSCVAQSMAKALEILDSKSEEAWSATPIYQKRSNRPQGGMIGWEALSIVTKSGSGYEKDIPSQLLSDSQMDSIPWSVEQIQRDRPTNYYIISNPQTGKVNFADLVNAVQTFGVAVIYVNASVSEWNFKPRVHNSNGTLRHAVAVHSVIQYKGEPYVVVDDSWGKFWYPGDEVLPIKDGQRMLSKDFVEKHCYFAGGFVDFKYESTPAPKYVFNNIMVLGQRDNKAAGEKDITMLQDKLKSMGLMPANIPSTGYYGPLTAKAVYAFQVKYNVDNLAVLDFLKGKRVGAKTLATLNAQ